MSAKTKPRLTARTADKYELYQEAVQNPEFEAQMVERFYRKARNRRPKTLREDFSGTFCFSCEWVKRHADHRAICIDLDPEPLEWGRRHNLSRLKPEQQQRVELRRANVLEADTPGIDIICAFNFSYWIFMTRGEMLRYFRRVYENLAPDGMMVMDCFGGAEAHSEQEEPRACEGFRYVWEHAHFYPLTSEMECRIHFEFRDGTSMRNAFRYYWRLWSPRDLSEILEEAGFQNVEFYWEGTDHDSGEGNGVFRKSVRGEAADCWIAYIVALK
ncbi:MAG: class I SAM-dependent methyltransferase [Spirochaetales bacterium]|nr:class I SAM-dependent methyltransferase [Leptospiraceae bacterium]MCP5481934.1 class I SAM-dependent methyltransferase [Spirochaetales bacterium]